MARAIMYKEPCSVACLSDGEGALLWSGAGFQTWHYLAKLGYHGNEIPSGAAQLAKAIARLDVIGLPYSGENAKRPDYRSKLLSGFTLWDIEPKAGSVYADCMVCVYLLFDFWLYGLIEGRRVLVVNNEAEKVAAALRDGHVPPALTDYVPSMAQADWRPSAVLPIMLENGLDGTEKALAEIADSGFKPDIALLGAGSRVVHLCVEIAERYSIPAIDLGFVMSELRSTEDNGGMKKMHDYYRREG